MQRLSSVFMQTCRVESEPPIDTIIYSLVTRYSLHTVADAFSFFLFCLFEPQEALPLQREALEPAAVGSSGQLDHQVVVVGGIAPRLQKARRNGVFLCVAIVEERVQRIDILEFLSFASGRGSSGAGFQSILKLDGGAQDVFRPGTGDARVVFCDCLDGNCWVRKRARAAAGEGARTEAMLELGVTGRRWRRGAQRVECAGDGDQIQPAPKNS